MAWFRVDDKFPRHPKVLRAVLLLSGNKTGVALKLARARLLAVWLEAGLYASEHATDGFVPYAVIEELADRAPREVADALVTVRLAEVADVEGVHGVRFHDWDHYNPTSAQVQAKQAADRERKRSGKGGRRS